MSKLDGAWVFFTHNTGDEALDFAVAGNLGSDGSGRVTEYVFEAVPYVGFVKCECKAGDDPSVNHLVIVDGANGRPDHHCDYTNGGPCDGASSNIDDDIMKAIAPGSPIIYVLYSSVGGLCIKEDEHRAIFDAAVRCNSGRKIHTRWCTRARKLVNSRWWRLPWTIRTTSSSVERRRTQDGSTDLHRFAYVFLPRYVAAAEKIARSKI
jgi:hypothetical protein